MFQNSKFEKTCQMKKQHEICGFEASIWFMFSCLEFLLQSLIPVPNFWTVTLTCKHADYINIINISVSSK